MRQIFANLMKGEAPVAPDKPRTMINIGADVRYGKANAKAARENAKTFKPSGRENISGLAYAFNQVRAPFADRYAANQEAAKQQAVANALINSGEWKEDEIALLQTGEPTIMQALMNARNARERQAAVVAGKIKVAERKAELGVGVDNNSTKNIVNWQTIYDEKGNVIGDEGIDSKTGQRHFVPSSKEGGRRSRAQEAGDKRTAQLTADQHVENQALVTNIAAGYKDVTEVADKMFGLGLDKFTGAVQGRQWNASAQGQQFEALLAQLEGGAFLRAFESLKGGGQITEIEGVKATQALFRARSATSREDFVDAINDYKRQIGRAMTKARALSGDAEAQAEVDSWTRESVAEIKRLKAFKEAYAKDPVAATNEYLKRFQKKTAAPSDGSPPQPTAEDVSKARKYKDMSDEDLLGGL